MSTRGAAKSVNWLYAGGMIAVLAASLAWSYLAIGRQALDELADQSRSRLTLFVSNLDAALDKYEHLPKLISTDHRLTGLVGDNGVADANFSNRYLKTVAETTGASDIYLMGQDGTTLAASNWEMPHSFVGRNFEFRPYFQQAMQGERGRYFALGSTSLQRGYYFSHPVYLRQSVAGVIVVKINLADIETAWAEEGSHFVVTDVDGIVFLSTQPEWTYRSLHPIAEERLEQIRASQRYLDRTFEPLKLDLRERVADDVARVALAASDAAKASRFLHLSQKIPDAGWTAHLFANVAPLKETQLLGTAVAGFAMLILLLLVVLYLTNRQRRLALQGSTELLEERVQQRTLELQNEVEERRKAEQSLRDTQSELIQAAKMAGLGQMSAGISHELNQPLTAIRNYSENAQRFIERDQPEAAAGNLAEISEVTERMAAIISQLRGFSRKSSGEQSQVSVATAVEQALGMFRREIEAGPIEVAVAIGADLSLLTDPLLLNQVLVNVISNAIQAMSDSARRRIGIEAGSTGSETVIQISDSGPGIADNVIENVFDPFFTTKEVGLGLGLGLSISYRIMESLGGHIEASNLAAGGACFRLYLSNG